MDNIKLFIAAMEADGCGPANVSDIEDTGGESRLIQAAYDKPGRKSLYYSLDGNFGHWHSCKTGEGGYWSGKAVRGLSAEDKARLKKEREERIKALEDANQARYEEMSKQLSNEWRSLEKCQTHPYLVLKSVQSYGVRLKGEAAVICGIDVNWKLWNLQSIYPDGSKYFSKDARKKGTGFPIGMTSKDVPEEIYVAEGYATAATIYEAVQKPTWVAFDAGNLLPFCKELRYKYPNAKIIVCGDNDAKPDGSNPGVEAAEKAAAAIGGFAIWPEEEGKDFNDIGVELTRKRLAAVGTQDVPLGDAHIPPPYDEQEVTGGGVHFEGDLGLPLRVLGYDQDNFYYYSFTKKMVVKLSSAQHTLNNLFHFASLEEWKVWATGSSTINISSSQLSTMAADSLINLAHRRGHFQEAANVRGSGAWMDAGRAVLHCGDVLYVDGVKTELHMISSKYVYISSNKLLVPHERPLESSDAVKLRHLCEALVWDNQLSGSLLAGWLVIAPICSMLEWRPHIWITGQAGAGKSTVLNRIVKPILGDIAMCYDGGTTEAAIRETMRNDGRPIVYDEAEPSDTMTNVMMLARKASSGSIITKYNQRPFNARFAACFSAINPPIKDFADETRISVMFLRKNLKASAREDYRKLEEMIEEIVTPEFSNALLARTISNMGNLLFNIKIFFDAANEVLHDSRSAQQVAPMLGGLYLLSSTGRVDFARAVEWVKEKDWTVHTAIAADPDQIRCLSHITGTIMPVRIGVNIHNYTIGEMIMEIYNPAGYQDQMNRALRQLGIAVLPDGVVIANTNNNLSKCLRGTDWETNWNQTLSNIPGSIKHKQMQFVSGEPVKRGLKIPREIFTG